eukprot:1743494-Pleurochrysis_carterae.AAC.1
MNRLLKYEDANLFNHCEVLDATLAQVLATDQTFAAEKLEADRLLSHWRLHVDVFRSTYGRAPVLYDFFCGQGT